MKSSCIRRNFLSTMLFLAISAFIVLPALSSSHEKSESGQVLVPLKSSPLKHGAQLYDNWPKLVGEKLSGSHPLYPAEGKKQGGSSWRCKECHGWDYIGKDGRYSKGSHYTGIKGVLGSSAKPVQKLFSKLNDSKKSHDFSPYMSKQELEALSVFLSEGLINAAEYLNADGSAAGDVSRGKKLYASHCAACHGDDGNAFDFKSKKDGVQGVGWLANDNPQESLHKIRWGHPSSDMPSVVVKDAVDILTYSQTMK